MPAAPDQQHLVDELRCEIEARRVVIVAGAGVTINATGDTSLSWKNLLRHGVEFCVRESLAEGDWGRRRREQLESSAIDELLLVATSLELCMRKERPTPWARWLRQVFKPLQGSYPAVIQALGRLNAPIVTLNYDDLIKQELNRDWATWLETDLWVDTLRGEDNVVLHIHGIWRRADTVVLGVASYTDHKYHALAQHLERTLATVSTLVFVGCGGTFEDPNFSALLNWIRIYLTRATHRHFLLVRRSELEAQRQQYKGHPHIAVVSYGDRYEDLPKFLGELAEPAAPRPIISRASVTPAADRLVTMIGLLPDGVRHDDLGAVLPGLANGAAVELQQAGLAHDDDARLRVLPSIREYLLEFRRPSAQDLARLIGHYLRLLDGFADEYGNIIDWERVGEIRAEAGNVEAIIRLALEDEDKTRGIEAAVRFAAYQAQRGISAAEPIESAIKAAREGRDQRRLASCLLAHGELAWVARTRYVAMRFLDEAKELFMSENDQEGLRQVRGVYDALGTNPAGVCFVSYRRSRIDDVKSLVRALNDHGIPTWQDVEDLGFGETEMQLRNVLAANDTAHAILYVTPDVAESDMIKKVEAPLAVGRAARDPNFTCMTVAAGSLDYDGAAGIFDGHLGVHDLRHHNLLRVASDPLDAADAAKIAQRLLRERLKVIHASLADDDPLRLSLSCRAGLGRDPSDALLLDWTVHFTHSKAPRATWDDRLLPALHAVRDAVRRQTEYRDDKGVRRCRRIEASGLPSVPAAFALGVTFLTTSGIELRWVQQFPDGRRETWFVGHSGDLGALGVKSTAGYPGVRDLAVLVSVTQNVEPDYGKARAELGLAVRRVVHIASTGPTPATLDAATAAGLARLVQQTIREERTTYGADGIVHLFMGGPAGLAVLIGQHLNTLHGVMTYQHDPGASPPYRQEVLLDPRI